MIKMNRTIALELLGVAFTLACAAAPARAHPSSRWPRPCWNSARPD